MMVLRFAATKPAATPAAVVGHHDNTLLNVTSPDGGPSYYTRHTADMLTGVPAVTNSVPKARNTRQAYFV